MQTVDDRASLRKAMIGWRRAGDRIAFVPTMGNLHPGHISLVDVARNHADRVVASIFVNPAQFGPHEDFKSYPRSLEADAERLEEAGCDLLFAPTAREIYPRGLEDAITVHAPPALASRLEGRFRPGHFDGVVTVVARLFLLVEPHCAVFGEKDFQQLLVVRSLADDLGFDIEIIAAPTRRDESGLALSSRNSYLSSGQRRAAAAIHSVMRETADRVRNSPVQISSLESDARSELESLGFTVDYVAIRRSDDLSPAGENDKNLRILVAAQCGSTRLIDNLPVDP